MVLKSTVCVPADKLLTVAPLFFHPPLSTRHWAPAEVAAEGARVTLRLPPAAWAIAHSEQTIRPASNRRVVVMWTTRCKYVAPRPANLKVSNFRYSSDLECAAV